MLRTGEEPREPLRDVREVWGDGEKTTDLASHPMFAPIVDDDTGQRCAARSNPPLTKEDRCATRTTVDTVLDGIGGPVAWVGDETAGQMWSLTDGKDVRDQVDPSPTCSPNPACQHHREHTPAHGSRQPRERLAASLPGTDFAQGW